MLSLLRPLLAATLAIASTLQLASRGRADPYDVYITAGQSNMDGRARVGELIGDLSAWSSPQPDALIHYTRPRDATDPGSPTVASGWTTMAPGYSLGPGSANMVPSATFGPELSFGRAMAAHRPDRKTAIVKVSRGGASLAVHWAPPGAINAGGDDAGDMYRALTTIVPQALQQLRAQGHDAQVRGMIWHQGESDAVPDATIYEQRLTQFIHSVRDDLSLPNLPFVIGELSGDSRGFRPLREAQANVSQAVPHAGFASSMGLTTYDIVHFDAASQIALGQRFADEMRTLPVPEPDGRELFGLSAAAWLQAIPRTRRDARRRP